MGWSDWRFWVGDGTVALPTKPGLAPQASLNRCARPALAAAAAAAVLALAACGDHPEEGGDCPPAERTHTLSGYCVPRYVSLRSDKVTARKGPALDYPALWIYRARGLPVQVVGETEDWRRICDPYGGAVWVRRSMISGRRTAQALGPGPTPLTARPVEGAKVEGMMAPRALAILGRCKAGWCELTVGGVKGWAPEASLWGTASAAQCR